MRAGRAWLAAIVAVAAAAGAVWHFFPEEAGRAAGQAGKALAPGPSITPVREVVSAPAHFQGREVTVQGTVSATSELVMSDGRASRFYTLKAEGGEIVVTVRESLPARGQLLRVTGVVSEAPRGKGLAPRLAEKRRERVER